MNYGTGGWGLWIKAQTPFILNIYFARHTTYITCTHPHTSHAHILSYIQFVSTEKNELVCRMSEKGQRFALFLVFS